MPQITHINKRFNYKRPHNSTRINNNKLADNSHNNIYKQSGSGFFKKIGSFITSGITSGTKSVKQSILTKFGSISDDISLKEYFKIFNNSISLKKILELLILLDISTNYDIYKIQRSIRKSLSTKSVKKLIKNFIKSIGYLSTYNSTYDENVAPLTDEDEIKEQKIAASYSIINKDFNTNLFIYCKTKKPKKLLIFIYIYITHLNIFTYKAYHTFIESIYANTYKPLYIDTKDKQKKLDEKKQTSIKKDEEKNAIINQSYIALEKACGVLLRDTHINKNNITTKYVAENSFSHSDIILDIYSNIHIIELCKKIINNNHTNARGTLTNKKLKKLSRPLRP